MVAASSALGIAPFCLRKFFFRGHEVAPSALGSCPRTCCPEIVNNGLQRCFEREFGLVINGLLGWLLLPSLAQGSIALSNSVGVGVQVVVLLLVARQRLEGIEGRALMVSLARTLVASALMAAAVVGVRSLLPGGGERLVVGQAQVTADPPNGGFHSMPTQMAPSSTLVGKTGSACSRLRAPSTLPTAGGQGLQSFTSPVSRSKAL